MHPAPSVIVFTVLSGTGFGLLTFLGLGIPEVTGWSAFGFFFVAYAMSVGGLVASTFHLGHPERALKAFTQWRSSWLSREAWLAVLALTTTGVHAIGVIFLDSQIWPIGTLGAILSLATVYATSMIYAQLRTVPRWNHPLTPAHFLSFSVAGGALLAGQSQLAALLLALAGALQIATWIRGDAAFSQRCHTMETATGLGANGAVRLFESPHSGSNYLLKEFVHETGRKHAGKLRAIALLGLSVLPAAFVLVLPPGHPAIIPVIALHLCGTTVSRWLFFAEAEHVTGLYYGKR